MACVSAADCEPVRQGMGEPGTFRYGPNSSASGRTVIDKSGHYCLKGSLRVEGHYWPITPEGDKLFSDDELIVMLAADDIVLDFNGYTATSDARLQAGVMTPERRTALSEDRSIFVPKNLTIRNGSIKVTRHGMAVSMTGVGPFLVNIVDDATEAEFRERFAGEISMDYSRSAKDQYGNPKHIEEWIRRENRDRAKLRAAFMPNIAAYPARNLRIENMRIRSQEDAVLLQGAGTVIRDSVIETDSGTALWLYGPGAVVENNTIIVHCLSRPIGVQGGIFCDKMDAPIRLQHGDGAVIRNNHFVLRDEARPRVLSLFDTGRITFEGNTFTGLDDPSKAVQVFRGPQEITTNVPNRVDNSLKARIEAWFK